MGSERPTQVIQITNMANLYTDQDEHCLQQRHDFISGSRRQLMARMATALLEIKKTHAIQSNEIQAVLGVWFLRNTSQMGNTVLLYSKTGGNCGVIADIM